VNLGIRLSSPCRNDLGSHPIAAVMRCLFILLALSSLVFSAAAAPSKQDATLEKRAKAVVISAPYPDYPYAARRAKITGRCLVEMHVDSSTGVVTNAVLAESSGHAILDNAALSACRRWRFKPGTIARVRLPITFAMPVTIYPNRWYGFSGLVRAVNVRAGTITVMGPTGGGHNRCECENAPGEKRPAHHHGKHRRDQFRAWPRIRAPADIYRRRGIAQC
jgi:TonB family protein